jgi:hypothetical protein
LTSVTAVRFGEEALGGAEEQSAVEPVDEDVVVE